MKRRSQTNQSKKSSGSYARKLAAGHTVLYHRKFTRWQAKYNLTGNGYSNTKHNVKAYTAHG